MKIKYFFTKKRLFFIVSHICLILILSKCGYQLSTNYMQKKTYATTNNEEFTILLCSYDPFNTITRIIKNELIINNIMIKEVCDTILTTQKKLIPCLNILNVSKDYIVISVFPNGTTSEYKIILKIQAQFFFPKTENYYPINMSIYRTLIRNPESDLSNLTQNQEILTEMYQDIAQKFVQKFLVQLHNFKIEDNN